jgi:hypothetical protein
MQKGSLYLCLISRKLQHRIWLLVSVMGIRCRVFIGD